MVKLYLAGPMRGIRDFNFPLFMRVGAALEDQGYEVFNPAKHDIEWYGAETFRSETGDLADLADIFDLRTSLGADLEFICTEADGVVVLEGWQESSGAKAEVATALALNLPVFAARLGYYDSAPELSLHQIKPSLTARTVDPAVRR